MTSLTAFCQDCGAEFSHHVTTVPKPKRCRVCRLAYTKHQGLLKTSINAMVRHSFIHYAIGQPSDGCSHHWRIGAPDGTGVLIGICKLCQEQREFPAVVGGWG